IAEVTLKPGQTKTVPIKVERTACKGPIRVELEDLPVGTTAEPATIAADASAGQVRVTTSADAGAVQKRFQIVATAGDLVVRGEPPISILAAGTPALLPIADVTLKPGESQVLKIAVNRNGFEGPIDVTFTGLPEKVTASAAVIAAEASAVKVKLTAAA